MASSGGAIFKDLILIGLLVIVPPAACGAGVWALVFGVDSFGAASGPHAPPAELQSSEPWTGTPPLLAPEPIAKPPPITGVAPGPAPDPLGPQSEPEPPAEPQPVAEPAAELVAPLKARLTRKEILDVTRASARSLQPCLREARANEEVKPGRVRLRLDFTVASDGSVSQARLRGPKRLRGTVAAACIEAVAGTWRFPASKSSAPIKNVPVAMVVK